jgi:hypothetical protein
MGIEFGLQSDPKGARLDALYITAVGAPPRCRAKDGFYCAVFGRLAIKWLFCASSRPTQESFALWYLLQGGACCLNQECGSLGYVGVTFRKAPSSGRSLIDSGYDYLRAKAMSASTSLFLSDRLGDCHPFS